MSGEQFVTRDEHLAAYKVAAQETAHHFHQLDEKFARYVESANRHAENVSVAINNLNGAMNQANAKIDKLETYAHEADKIFIKMEATLGALKEQVDNVKDYRKENIATFRWFISAGLVVAGMGLNALFSYLRVIGS